MKIILDNGHGSDTSGKRSPRWANEKQLFEYEFNRDIVVDVYDRLLLDGIDCEILVPEMYDIPIRERVERANEIHRQTESVFISVHGNSAPNGDTRPSGVETFYYSKSGKVFAEYLQESIVERTNWRNRGTRKAYQRIKKENGKTLTIYKIAILKFTNMVAILTENGFYSNFDQCMEMLEEGTRSDISIAHVNGVKNYLEFLSV